MADAFDLQPVDYDPFSAEQAGSQWLAGTSSGGLAGLMHQPSWIDQAADLSQRQEAMRQAGATQGQIVQGTLDQAINVTPQFAGSINTDPLFHGSPQMGLRTLSESDRGPLGPGVYTSPSNQIAGHYAGDAGTVYQLPEQERDIFRGAGHRTDDEWFGFKDDKTRLLNAAEPDKQDAVSAILDKAWSNDGYPVYQQLVRLYGSNDAAQALYKRAGFQGLSGLVDGPETLLFGNQPLTQGIRAFHGSPYDFEKFSLDKIGTGEGAQAYGHGLYFAENPGTAKAYRSQLAGAYMSTNDGLTRGGDVWQQINDAAKSVGGLHPDQSGEIARRIMNDLEKGGTNRVLKGYDSLEDAASDYVGGDPRFTPGATAALKKAVELGVGGRNKGRMYEVNIAADPEHFLDWDKPLSEQSPRVQQVLMNIPEVAKQQQFQTNFLGPDKGLTGKSAYAAAAKWNRGADLSPQDPAALTAQLRQAGIPGIKYLDQGSRLPADVNAQIADLTDRISNTARHPADPVAAAAQIASDKQALAKLTSPQTHNYVVFDDNLVNIIKKYGLAGLIAGGAAHFKTTPVEGDPFADQMASGGAVKATKEKAHYRVGSKAEHCAVCTMFRAPSSCTAVRGFIARRAVCDFFKKKIERANGGRVDPDNIEREPSEAQKKAGNYAKDHVRIHGMDISIENAKGHYRRGVDKGGKPWQVKMPAHYGYIKGTEGRDKDHVDVYLGPHRAAPHVYVVDQVDADSKKFDEHKAFLGFASEQQARDTYRKAFSDGRGHERIGHVSTMTVEAFKHWLMNGDTTKPSKQAEPKINNSYHIRSGANSGDDGTVFVDRRIPKFSPKLKDKNGNPANLWKYLAIHETDEAGDMSGGYDAAHRRATAKERVAVEADGVNWKEYTAEIDGYLAKIERQKATRLPPEHLHVDPDAAVGHHRSSNKQRLGDRAAA